MFDDEDLMRVIGFCGRMHSGKSTAAKLLVERREFTKIAFADPLKKMCIAGGMSEEQVYGTPEQKEKPFIFVPDRSAMELMFGAIHEDVFYQFGIPLREAFDKLIVIYPSREEGWQTTPRRVMQLLGTEWGRSLHEDLWVTIWKRFAQQVLHVGGKVVCDDVRFTNEAATLHSFHPKNLIELQTSDSATSGIPGHASEQHIAGDDIIFNEKIGVERLWVDILNAMEDFGG
jgi:hypothetical protein